MRLKKGKVVRPFGASSKITGEVSENIAKWLIDKGLCTIEDFESTEDQEARQALEEKAAKRFEAELPELLLNDVEVESEEVEPTAKVDAEPKKAATPKRKANRKK